MRSVRAVDAIVNDLHTLVNNPLEDLNKLRKLVEELKDFSVIMVQYPSLRGDLLDITGYPAPKCDRFSKV